MNTLTKTQKIIISAVLMLAGIVLGFLHAKSLGVNLFEEQVHTVTVTTEDDIIAMGDSFHNNICTLESDIVVNNVSSLASSELPFVGVFDGQGHTITFAGDVSKSLFGYIGKGGVVKNLNIEVASCDFDAKVGAILALENEGTIINCRIVVNNIKLPTSGMYAAVVTHNSGLIKNVYTKVSFTNTVNPESTAVKRSIIGGIAAYNYGEISSSISEISYSNFEETVAENVFYGSVLNTSLGAVYGSNEQGTIKNCAAVIDKTAYVADCKNNNVFFATSDERNTVFSAEMLFDDLGFDVNRWTYKNSTLTLIEGEDDEYSK